MFVSGYSIYSHEIKFQILSRTGGKFPCTPPSIIKYSNIQMTKSSTSSSRTYRKCLAVGPGGFEAAAGAAVHEVEIPRRPGRAIASLLSGPDFIAVDVEQRRYVAPPPALLIKGLKLFYRGHPPPAAGNRQACHPSFCFDPCCNLVRPGHPFQAGHCIFYNNYAPAPMLIFKHT